MLRYMPRVAFHAMRVLIAPVIALLLVSSDPASAETGSVVLSGQWETIANGNNIWSLAKDGPNTLWAGTRGGGVVKWDISDLSHPTYQQYLYPQTGLASNEVRSVAVDAQGNRWFATDRGLSRLGADNQWATFTLSNTLTLGATKMDTVTDPRDAGQRDLPLQTFDITVLRDKFTATPYFKIEGDPTIYRYAWADISTNGNFIYVDPPLQQPVAAGAAVYPMTFGLPSNNVTALAVAPNGHIFVGTQQFRIQTYQGECDTPISTRFSGGGGLNYLCDGTKYLGGGVAEYDPSTKTWRSWNSASKPFYYANSNVASNNVTDMTVDPTTGQIWATFWPQYRWVEPDRTGGNDAKQGDWHSGGDGGISSWDGTSWTTYQNYTCNSRTDNMALCRDGSQPTVNSVSAVTIDAQGRPWFAIYGLGLQVKSGGSWPQIRAYFTNDSSTGGVIEALSEARVYKLATDGQGRIWAATATDTGIGSDISIANANCAIANYKDTTCWLHVKSVDAGQSNGLSTSTIRTLLADGDRVWAGTSDVRNNGAGINAVNLDGAVTARLRTNGPLSNNITKIAARQNGEVWIGTGRADAAFYGRGVSVLNPQADWQSPAAWQIIDSAPTQAEQVGTFSGPGTQGNAYVYINVTGGNTVANCNALAALTDTSKFQFGDDPQPYVISIAGWDPGKQSCYIYPNPAFRKTYPAGTPIIRLVQRLNGSNIGDIRFDGSNRVWIGIRSENVKRGENGAVTGYGDGGVTFYDGVRWQTYGPKQKGVTPTGPVLNGGPVTVVMPRGTCETPEKMWVGQGDIMGNPLGYGIDAVDPAAKVVTALNNQDMPSAGIADLALDPTNCDVWGAFYPSYRYNSVNGYRLVNGGVGRYNQTTNVWTAYGKDYNTAGLEGWNSDVSSVLVDAQRRVWAGSYTVHATTYTSPPTLCYDPACTGEWIVAQHHTDAVLNLFQNNKWQPSIKWLYEGAVSDIVQDSDGRLWVATSHGWLADVMSSSNPLIDHASSYPLMFNAVHVLDGTTWTTVDIRDPQYPFTDDNITSIAQAPNGDMWFGTPNMGVVHWHKTGQPAEPTATPTSSPTAAPTASSTATATGTIPPTKTPTATRTATPPASLTATPTGTPIPATSSPTASPTRTASPSATPTNRPVVMRVFLPHVVGGVAAPVVPTATATETPPPGVTPSLTHTPTVAAPPSTATATAPAPPTATTTATETAVPTDTATPIHTATPTATSSPTPTDTATSTPTRTPTRTPTPTLVPQWELVSSPDPNSNTLRAIDCVDASNCWAVGDSGTILRWNGRAWSKETVPFGTPNLRSIVMVSRTDGWAVGDNKTILRYGGSSWTAYPVNSIANAPNGNYVSVSMSLNAPAFTPGGFILARVTNGDAALLYWDRSSERWLTSTVGSNANNMNGVHVTADGSLGAIVGDLSSMLQYDGSGAWLFDASVLNFQDVATLYSARFYRFAPNVIPAGWIVGANRVLAYYSNNCRQSAPCWRQAEPAMIGSDVPNVSYYGVSIVNQNRAWAVGDSGAIIRWDGTRWSRQTSTGATLRAVSMLSEQEGWAVGDGGAIYHMHP
ncbi:MAG: two-component regulator propeller domain-containing protein [Anaerolineae bacterium]